MQLLRRPSSIHLSLPPNSPLTLGLDTASIISGIRTAIIIIILCVIVTIIHIIILRSTAQCVLQEEEAGRGESEVQPLIQDQGHVSHQVSIML